MPFENQEQQREIRQQAPVSQLSARAGEYQTCGSSALQLRNSNEMLIAQGTLTNLQIQSDTDAPGRVETVSGASAAGYGTTELSKNFYATGIVLNPNKDLRSPEEKFKDFADAAVHRLTDPRSIQDYTTSEQEKLAGIGEGLNSAKEKVKATAVAAWNAVTDGSVAHFLSKPNAVNEPLFGAITSGIEAAKKDPNATNNALVRLGQMVGEASEQYSRLPPREQGKVIGETMFGCVNPEGSTEAAEAALKAADRLATHVDAHVMNTVEKSVQAIEKMRSTAPEFVQQSKEMLQDYIAHNRLTGQQLEYAGVHKGYFDSVTTSPSKQDSFYAMSKADGEDGVLKGHREVNGEKGALKGQPELVEGVNYRVEPKTGRLQRIDLGKVREPYEWPVYNERFDPNCIRQSGDGTCMSACGEMVTNGRVTEAELIPILKIPGNIRDLPSLLGPEWTSETWINTSLARMDKGGSWVAQMYDGEFRPPELANMDTKEPHIVVVDGPTPDLKRMKIRDPLEGTSYEMTFPDFIKAWGGPAAYRRVD